MYFFSTTQNYFAENRFRSQVYIIFGIIIFLFSAMNLYLVAIFSHESGDPTLTCNAFFTLSWFYNIDWSLMIGAYLRFDIEKLILLSGIGFSIILCNALLNVLWEKNLGNKEREFNLKMEN